MIITKICTMCKEEKEIHLFSIQRSVKCGRTARCKTCTAVEAKKYYKSEARNRASKRYREANKEKVRAFTKSWNDRNKDKQAVYRKRSYQKRVSTLNGRLEKNLRARLFFALNGKKKTEATIDLLGCSVTQLKQHIASKFKKGMSWDNYGYKTWHIDHIRPCDSFDLSDEQQQKECFHYTNLQPLWAKENIRKNNKF